MTKIDDARIGHLGEPDQSGSLRQSLVQTFLDLWFLARMLRSEAAHFVLSVAALVVGQLGLIVIAIMSIQVTIGYIVDPAPHSRADSWLPWIFAAVVVTAIAALLETWWAHELAYRVLARVRSNLFAAIERVAPLGLQKRRTADVASRAMSDVEQLEWFYAHTVGTGLVALLAPVVASVYLSQRVGAVSAFIVLAALLMVVPVLCFFRIQRIQGQRRRDAMSALGVVIYEGIHGLREILLLNATNRQRERIGNTSRNAHRAHQKNQIRSAAEAAGAECVVSVTVVTALLSSILMVQSGHLQRSDLPVVIVCITAALVPVLSLVSMLSRCGEIGVCARRVRDVLDAPSPLNDARNNPEPINLHERGLCLDGVSFGYAGDSTRVLNGLSLRVTPGQHMGIVGPSGVGKSTLTTLLMRFADPLTGSIRLDGQDLRDISPTSHRERVGLLPQSGHVFRGSVRENLALAKPDATPMQMQAALEAAHLADTLCAHAGLETLVGDGNLELSGGERQRLCIARAILRDSEVLIMDEPLANVDPALETSIIAALQQHRSDKTTIMVSHRVKQIVDSDVIAVLEPDGSTTVGSHTQLLEASAFYAQMCSQQEGAS